MGSSTREGEATRLVAINEDEKFFNMIMSKETSKGNTSCRSAYYGSPDCTIPFIWESCPGTPKQYSLTNTPPLPLTPPPSYSFCSRKKIMRMHYDDSSHSPRLDRNQVEYSVRGKKLPPTPAALKKPKVSSSSSSSLSSTSSSSCSLFYASPSNLFQLRKQRRRAFVSCLKPSASHHSAQQKRDKDDDEDDQDNHGSPTSAFFYSNKIWNRFGFADYAFMKNMKNALVLITGNRSTKAR